MFTFRERGFYMKEKIQKRAKRIRIRWKKRKVKITVALLLLVWLAVIIVLLKHWRLFGRSANGGSVNCSMGVSLDHWNSRSNIMAILCLVFKKAKDNQKNRNWWYDSIGYCDGNRHVLGYGMDL